MLFPSLSSCEHTCICTQDVSFNIVPVYMYKNSVPVQMYRWFTIIQMHAHDVYTARMVSFNIVCIMYKNRLE